MTNCFSVFDHFVRVTLKVLSIYDEDENSYQLLALTTFEKKAPS